MKVSELISHLKGLSGDTEVFIEDRPYNSQMTSSCGQYYPSNGSAPVFVLRGAHEAFNTENGLPLKPCAAENV